MGQLKKALLALFPRAGEGPRRITEQLALQQLFRDGGAVDRDKGAAGPHAGVVDAVGKQLLSRAGLAFYQHGGVCPGIERRQLFRPAKAGIVRQDIVKGIPGLEALLAEFGPDLSFQLLDLRHVLVGADEADKV